MYNDENIISKIIKKKAKSLLSDLIDTKNIDNACDDLVEFARSGELPMAYYVIGYGIQYARQTGRLPGQVELQLRSLKGNNLIKLFDEMLKTTKVVRDVAPYLIKKFS